MLRPGNYRICHGHLLFAVSGEPQRVVGDIPCLDANRSSLASTCGTLMQRVGHWISGGPRTHSRRPLLRSKSATNFYNAALCKAAADQEP